MKLAAIQLGYYFVALLGAFIAGDGIRAFYDNGQVLLALISGTIAGLLLILAIVHFTIGLPKPSQPSAGR